MNSGTKVSTKVCRAKKPWFCRYHIRSGFPFTNRNGETLILKQGVWVVEDKLTVSDFAKTFNTPDGDNAHYGGSWSELQELVKAHWSEQEPGLGSVDGDVILVTVPSEGFFSSVVEITEDNQSSVFHESVVRQEGEKPVMLPFIEGVKHPAVGVQVVCYRADVLQQDDDRSSDAEWEIVAVIDKDVPMYPETMKRNSNHEAGGTLRVYTDEEWAVSEKFWATHAYVKPES